MNIKKEEHSNEDLLIKSLEDNYQDKMHHTTYYSNELTYNNNSINNYEIDRIKHLSFISKKKYFPLELNNMIIIRDKKFLNHIIKRELEFKKIIFVVKRGKYYCWKNDHKFTIEIIKADGSNNCYVININRDKQNNNYFNISFCKELVATIINKIKNNK